MQAGGGEENKKVVTPWTLPLPVNPDLKVNTKPHGKGTTCSAKDEVNTQVSVGAEAVKSKSGEDNT